LLDFFFASVALCNLRLERLDLAEPPRCPGADVHEPPAARETLGYRQRLHPPADPLAPVAAIAYQAMSTVPENWIPFIQLSSSR